jgi:hypothetical protein
MPIFNHRPSTRSLRAGLTALLLGFVAITPSWSQQTTAGKKELSEKVSEELGKIRTQTDAKNYDAAIAMMDC